MRNDLFTMRVNDAERKMIAALAEHLQRTQSDAVRFIIRGAAHELNAVACEGEKRDTAQGKGATYAIAR